MTLILLAFTPSASPQINRNPAPDDQATVERPDFSVRVPRPNAPRLGEEDIVADTQEADNGVRHLRGKVRIELHNATFTADEADYDENTFIFTARGHVYYRNYEQNEVIYCDRAEYNTDTERGMFYNVHGYAKTKVIARPGVLTTQSPFYFEGQRAEKIEDRYVLYDGFITDCKVPNPWWTLHADLINIIPDDHAVTRKAVYHLKGLPVFYFPYFYKSLKKEPRKSGFLTPNVGNSSTRGYMFGLGYYYAISRSLDITYLFQDFTTRGYAHHIDFRGKPSQKTDFNLIFYGVEDRGYYSGATLIKAPGYSLTGDIRTELGDGWVVRGSLNYISSLAFRQQFSESFNEAIFAETQSTGSISKDFSYYTFTADADRTEDYLSATTGDSVLIRKLPEFDFTGRDQQISSGPLPLWLSFDGSYTLWHRAEPTAPNEPGFYETSQFSSRADFEPTVTSALHWGQLNIVPSFTMHETYYGQSLLNGAVSSQNLTRSAPEVNLDIVLPSIERVFNKKTFLGDKLKHVIEPRVSYKYVSDVKRFSDTLHFDPIDLLSDTNELEVGVTNRLYAKKGDSVNEVLSWEIFQKRFFDPTFGGAVVPGQANLLASVLDMTGYTFLDGPRNYSPIVSILRGSPRSGVSFTWEADYDPLQHRIVNTSLTSDFRVKRYFLSAGSDQLRPDPAILPQSFNQFRTTFGYGDPNRKGWNAAFSSVYDLRLHRLEYGVAQATYNTDCCGISVQIRRLDFGTRNENQYLVSFSIANIGSVGNLKKQDRLF
ncbi:MAG: LPS-assembly protein LptD [Acidobacteriota bacterium]|nr:LPS-assembly protein LptD [Acidobacteriota bacterium]